MTVSIIIPLYNKEAMIAATLNSVYLQDYKDWECLIVDDGSTDTSVEVAEHFLATHTGNWKIIKQKNQGQAIARNNGIENAKGEYLAFLDADDLWPLDKLTTQVKAMQSHPAAVAALSSYAIFGDGSIRLVHQPPIGQLMERWMDMSGFGGGLESVGLVRSNLVKDVGYFDPTLSTSSGLDFTLRLHKVGEILVLNKLGLYYRISPGQWHSNHDELARNTDLIDVRYGSMYRGDLKASVAAYFFWVTARQHGRYFLLTQFLKALYQLRNRRAQMLLRLAWRNIKASFRGRFARKRIAHEIEMLESVR